MKAMIIPGNGNTDISENWFPYVKTELEKLGIEVIAENMPDPDLARKEYWFPFIEGKIGEDEDVILIGHSSGAVAIMRYLEDHKAKMAVLVGVCYTDLGSEHEELSGYYDSPWRWDKIKKNCPNIIQFASRTDPYIPLEEARFIADNLNTEYHEYPNLGHFGSDVQKTEFSEIVDVIRRNL